jgi:hypothetical protein
VRVTMNIQRAIVVVAFAFLTACGSHPESSPLPSTPSPVPPPSPPPYQILNGYAYNTAFRPVAGATVTVLDGAQAGATTTSNEVGKFAFTGAFTVPTTLKVVKDGYITATVTARSNGSSGAIWAYVMLDAVARPVDLVGDYTLTIVADSACTGIPNELQTRNWPASIGITSGSNTQPGTSLTLAVSGGSFLANQDRFPIGVSGGDVTFSVYSGEEEVGLVEKIAAGTFLAIGGSSLVSIDSGPVAKISAPFWGAIDYCALQSDTGWNYQCNSGPQTAYAHCESTQHQMILTRR